MAMENPLDVDKNWWLLLIPALAFIGFVTLSPIVWGFFISFFYWVLADPPIEFIGLGGFQELFNSGIFQYSFFVTILFSGLTVIFTTFIGLVFSLLLNRQMKGRGVIRALILIPWAVPHIVNGIIWSWMLNGRFGVIPYILVTLGIADENLAFLSTPSLAIFAIVMAHTWKYVPICILILLSNLQAIPIDLYEAAKVDGASARQQLRYITLPLLRNGILIAITFITMWSLRTFDAIYAMTGGGPAGATNILGWFVYNKILIDFNYGIGSAASVILAILTMCVALAYYRIFYRRTEY
jgi:ABC-type sugar transport system permease subunit